MPHTIFSATRPSEIDFQWISPNILQLSESTFWWISLIRSEYLRKWGILRTWRTNLSKSAFQLISGVGARWLFCRKSNPCWRIGGSWNRCYCPSFLGWYHFSMLICLNLLIECKRRSNWMLLIFAFLCLTVLIFKGSKWHALSIFGFVTNCDKREHHIGLVFNLNSVQWIQTGFVKINSFYWMIVWVLNCTLRTCYTYILFEKRKKRTENELETRMWK